MPKLNKLLISPHLWHALKKIADCVTDYRPPPIPERQLSRWRTSFVLLPPEEGVGGHSGAQGVAPHHHYKFWEDYNHFKLHVFIRSLKHMEKSYLFVLAINLDFTAKMTCLGVAGGGGGRAAPPTSWGHGSCPPPRTPRCQPSPFGSCWW